LAVIGWRLSVGGWQLGKKPLKNRIFSSCIPKVAAIIVLFILFI
jgi:hypothetical protein